MCDYDYIFEKKDREKYLKNLKRVMKKNKEMEDEFNKFIEECEKVDIIYDNERI